MISDMIGYPITEEIIKPLFKILESDEWSEKYKDFHTTLSDFHTNLTIYERTGMTVGSPPVRRAKALKDIFKKILILPFVFSFKFLIFHHYSGYFVCPNAFLIERFKYKPDLFILTHFVRWVIRSDQKNINVRMLLLI